MVALVGASLAAPVAQASPPQGLYIVVLNSGDPGAVAAEHARDHGAQVGFVYRHALRGYAAAIPEQQLAAVRADTRVAYVNEDRSVHASGHTAGAAPTGVHRSFAPDNANIHIDGSDDLRVDADIAIIDTGIDIDHPDLNVVGGKNCQTGTSYDDGNGHGTHVAGSAAGLDNGSGVVGMAPGARLWAVRVLNNAGSGSWSSVLCGVDWVTAQNTDTNGDGTLDTSNDIEVANMSLGGSGSEPAGEGCSTGDALHDGICNSVEADVTYAVAAGNETDDAANHVPAAYDEVITVSALADFDGIADGLGLPTCRTDGDDTFADFSNFGADVDLIAPGVCITSTWKGGGYNTISGTSMASPHVAGAAALYKATNAQATPTEVQLGLQSSANLDWFASDDGDPVQEGLLDVHDSLVFAPAMVAGSATGGGGGTEPTTGYELTATGYKVKGLQKADLAWSGTTAEKIDIYRDGALINTVDNTGAYTDHIDKKGGGTYTYKVCDAGITTCSNEAMVTF